MNVILIMVDSFRKDHLGCYGNKWIRTPKIDRLASESFVLDSAYAEGLPTIPVRVSLFTGRFTLPFRGWESLVQQDLPISEILWNKGVKTALISDTYHMHKPMFDFCRGFDYVEWIRGQEEDPWIVNSSIEVDLSQYSEKNWLLAYPGQSIRVTRSWFEQYLRNRSSWRNEDDHHIAKVTKASIRWLEKEASNGFENRFFLVVDSFDPHEPWDPPADYLDMYPVPEYSGLPIIWGGGEIDKWTLPEIKHIRANYAGTITLVDKWIGLFLEKIDELGLLENTAIILLSDHGEPLGEHGIIKKVKPWPYEELSHIPLIIRLPDIIGSEAKRVIDFVGIQDLAPTILNFFNVHIPSVMQGKNLQPILQGEEKGMKFAISGFYRRSWRIRNHEWSYYVWIQSKKTILKNKSDLYKYDLGYLPQEPSKFEIGEQAEVKNLAGKEMNLSSKMKRQLQQFINSLEPSAGDNMTRDLRKQRMILQSTTKA